MNSVFVSYSRSDRLVAELLLQHLRYVGVTVWMDKSNLAAGEAISQSIRNALAHSDAVVVVVSEQSLRSKWVQFEIGAAIGLGKKLLPVVVTDVGEAMPEFLQNVQWLDARGKPLREVALEIERAIQS